MYKGGYVTIKEPMLKTGIFKHTAGVERPVPDTQLAALNRIQETPWTTCDEVCAVATEAIQNDYQIAALPPMDVLPLPPMMSEQEWEVMTDEEKAHVKAERERVHSMNAKATGQREALLRKQSLLRDLGGQTFWFPHAMDWRGRAYAIPQDLNPQSDDFARGVLMFADGEPLGPDGAEHLALRGAANFGMDKVSFDERVQWFVDNEQLIIDSAVNPLHGERFWCEAEQPWQFLATCMAWKGYLKDGENYVCNLPIPFDATCSGLQHLSAMGLSEFGGRMVNLTSDPQRHDVYMVVADKVVEIMNRDALAGEELAKNWLGHVGRKTVKRQTMTLCYGATVMGMRKMALEDGHCDGLPGNRVRNAQYLTNCILDAIADVLSEGKLIMDWLQECATAVSLIDQPISFVTPMGMQVRQAYYKRGKKRVCTIFGEAILWEEDSTLGIDKNRMRQSIVPNVIHAYDAAHLYATVNNTVAKLGEEISWGVVHDSFATWAGRASSAMNQAIREEFVHIYEHDQLDHLYQAFLATGADIPTPPARGNLDITEVLGSRYFFS